MENLLNLSKNTSIKNIKGNYIITVAKKQYCACNGKLHIHTTIEKNIKVLHILNQDAISALIRYFYYECQLCGKYFLDDGGLGIQHQTTLDYRKTICLLAAISTVTQAAQTTGINRSTIRHWQKQLRQKE